MNSGSDPPAGGLVTALHAALRAHARQQEGAWFGLAQFLPTLRHQAGEEWGEVVLQALTRLRHEHPQEAELLYLRYWKNRTAESLATEWNVALSTLYHRQRKAIRTLARYLWQMEQEEQSRLQRELAYKTRHLPPPTYTRLFGVHRLLQKLETWLQDPNGPRVVSIEGLGGLGKTTLAHALVQRTLFHWNDVAWISAHAHPATWEEQARPLEAEDLLDRLAWQMAWRDFALLPPNQKALECRVRLAQRRYLVVWDDVLPSIAHHLQSALPPGPTGTRFVMTSRYRLPIEGRHVHLQELSRKDALALLRYEAGQRGLPPLSSEVLETLYQHFGGHPLALKLAVAYLEFLPLKQTLRCLWKMTVDKTLSPLAHVYQPLLQRLPPYARQVLEMFPAFAPAGVTYEELLAFSQLPPTRLDEALFWLVYTGLVLFDPRTPPRYTIHRLTYGYLTQEADVSSNPNNAPGSVFGPTHSSSVAR